MELDRACTASRRTGQLCYVSLLGLLISWFTRNSLSIVQLVGRNINSRQTTVGQASVHALLFVPVSSFLVIEDTLLFALSKRIIIRGVKCFFIIIIFLIGVDSRKVVNCAARLRVEETFCVDRVLR